MKRKQVIKAVFFDLDGTLLNTLPDIARVVNYALSKNSLPVFGVEEYRDMVGWGLTKTIRMAVPEEIKDSELLKKIRLEMQNEYAANPVVGTVPYPGIMDMLREFQSRGTAMGILSNKDDAITRKVVHTVLGEFTFAGVRGSSLDVPPKPDPTGMKLLLEKAGLSPGQMMFVGDTAMDMVTAGLIGAYPVGVSWGYRTEEQLIDAGAQRIVHSPGQILDLFLEMSLDTRLDALV